jgi:hypothetical protein
MTQYLISVYQPDDTDPTSEAISSLIPGLHAWVNEVHAANAWVFGAGLFPASTATVLKRSGEDVLITDGPFLEGKEHVAGFTIIEASDKDAALDWARKLALARRAPVELRPMRFDEEAGATSIEIDTSNSRAPYFLSVYQPYGPPPPPEVLDPIMKEVYAWADHARTAGALVCGVGLGPETHVFLPTTADVLMTDGPYLEGKEHLGGFDILMARDLDEALDWARGLSRVLGLPLEVRPMQVQ